MSNWTAKEFYNKVEYEGGYEGMYYYAGQAAITDDIELETAWNKYVSALQELERIEMRYELEDATEDA